MDQLSIVCNFHYAILVWKKYVKKIGRYLLFTVLRQNLEAIMNNKLDSFLKQNLSFRVVLITILEKSED